jgi:putative oxidoreductase
VTIGRMNLALFALRLVIGVVFVAHGAQKLFGAFGGAGLAGTGRFVERLGLRPGRLHASAAGVAELAGGALIAAGLLTPVGAAALIAVMTTAVLKVHRHNGLFFTDNGYEYNLTIAAVAFSLAGAGAGAWSLDRAFGLDLAGAGWALAALAAGILGGLAALGCGRLSAAYARRTREPDVA